MKNHIKCILLAILTVTIPQIASSMERSKNSAFAPVSKNKPALAISPSLLPKAPATLKKAVVKTIPLQPQEQELIAAAKLKSFFEAIDKKNCDLAIQEAKKNNISLNTPINAHGWTLLIYNAYRDNATNMQKLITAGADVNAAENDGTTALMHSAGKGNLTTAQLLINAKAKLNAVDKDGVTALMHSTYHGNLATTQLLVTEGADIHKIDNYNGTALSYASQRGHLICAGVILKKKLYEAWLDCCHLDDED